MEETGAWVVEVPLEQRTVTPKWFMKTPEWQVRDGDATHRIRMEHNTLSSRVSVYVDGELRMRKLAWSFRHQWSLEVGGKTATLRLVTLPVPQADLSIAGAELLPVNSASKGLGLAGPMPKWGWAFVAACLLIPLVTLGGALPVVIGLSGAALCAKVSRSPAAPGARVAQCVAITLGAWVLLLCLVIVMAQLRSG